MEDSITTWQTPKTLREVGISLCKEKLLWEVTFVLFLYYLTTWSSRRIYSREVHNRVRKLNTHYSEWQVQKESLLVAKEWRQVVEKSKYEKGIPESCRNSWVRPELCIQESNQRQNTKNVVNWTIAQGAGWDLCDSQTHIHQDSILYHQNKF